MLKWLQNPEPAVWQAGLNILISFASGFIIGATEIISTFQYRKKLFRTPALRVFLFLYGVMGTTAYILLAIQLPAHWGNPLSAFLAGISPHVLLRSRFSLVRSRDEKGEKKLDVSLDLEKVFNTWVAFIKRRIDVMYLQDRRAVIDRLARKFETSEAMLEEAVKVLYTLQALGDEDRRKMIEEAELIFEGARDIYDRICLHRLADIIVRYSDFDALSESLALEPGNNGIDRKADTVPRKSADPVDIFLAAHPEFIREIDRWTERLNEDEKSYLVEQILRSTLTDQGRARAAARFLYRRGKLTPLKTPPEKEEG
ncbi:hypothetical protein [Desulfonema ishimotonii]|uniref:hypothetical protein n=1 Tax=Desulfonema ishimotonii TaxID=45657 RepID=UPI000F58A8C7|nr:hypothetical protein [Desulfonema ishimotonii]